MLLCLTSPNTPPVNQLRERPDVARYIGLYSMSKNLGGLPESGGLLDQSALIYAYFSVFAAAEAEWKAGK